MICRWHNNSFESTQLYVFSFISFLLDIRLPLFCWSTSRTKAPFSTDCEDTTTKSIPSSGLPPQEKTYQTNHLPTIPAGGMTVTRTAPAKRGKDTCCWLAARTVPFGCGIQQAGGRFRRWDCHQRGFRGRGTGAMTEEGVAEEFGWRCTGCPTRTGCLCVALTGWCKIRNVGLYFSIQTTVRSVWQVGVLVLCN